MSLVGTRPRPFGGQSWRIRHDIWEIPLSRVSCGRKVGDASPNRIFPPFSQLKTMGFRGSFRLRQRYSTKSIKSLTYVLRVEHASMSSCGKRGEEPG